MIRYNDKLLLVRFHTSFRTSLGCVSYPKDPLHLFPTKMLFLKTRNQNRQQTQQTKRPQTTSSTPPLARSTHSFELFRVVLKNTDCFCLNLFSVGQCTRPHFWSSVVVSKKHDVQVSKTLVNAPTARKDA